ncbi:MAG: argininosuccinate synthase [Thermoplasmatota archaeon]
MKHKRGEEKEQEIDKIVLAYSGGLDTSFCIPFLKEKYGAEVFTITVDTGGFSREELIQIEENSKKLGAAEHCTSDVKSELFNDFLLYLIKGNILKGDVYPLSVGAERVLQAVEIVNFAKEVDASIIAHGSTPAGNDQVRFDVAFNTLVQDIEVIAPIRDFEISREEEANYLEEIGFPVKEEVTTYSINAGLWGTTIGGGATHDSWKEIPEEAYRFTNPIPKTPDEPEIVDIEFQEGVPVSIDGEPLDGLEIVERLNDIGKVHGVGRGIHIGDTIMGIKGRIAFEAPAPLILIQAHKELEKIVLTKWQRYWKDQVSDFFGMLLHEALYFDPVCEDIKAFIDSTQKRVTGNVKVELFKGGISVKGCKSPHSLMCQDKAAYGEDTSLWAGRDAKGFCKIYGLPGILAKSAEEGDELFEDKGS